MKIVILAGGQGSRLWPLSTRSRPKQFLRPEGEFSLLEKTILRFLPKYGAENILIVTNTLHESLLLYECLEPMELAHSVRVLSEPIAMGTAAAFALALAALTPELSPLEPVLLAPADCFLSDEREFLSALDLCEAAASRGNLVLFGIPPTKIETGYGYIEIGQREGDLFQVTRFLEKPPIEVATTLFFDLPVLWNTGHVLLTAETFYKEISSYNGNIPRTSFDYAVLEKSSHVRVFPLQGKWSDVGSWDSLYDLLPKDSQNNTLQGDVQTIDVRNSLLVSEKLPLKAIGIENILAVASDEGILLCHRDRSQEIKHLHPTQEKGQARPWGYYTVLEEGPFYKVKKITVYPHHRLSLQWHRHRSEHWIVVSGQAFVEIGDQSFCLCANENTFISPLTIHRLSNRESTPLEVIEIQSGSILDEEDIVRLEDDYARKEPAPL